MDQNIDYKRLYWQEHRRRCQVEEERDAALERAQSHQDIILVVIEHEVSKWSLVLVH